MTIRQKKNYKISNVPLVNHSKPSTRVFIWRTQEEFLAFWSQIAAPILQDSNDSHHLCHDRWSAWSHGIMTGRLLITWHHDGLSSSPAQDDSLSWCIRMGCHLHPVQVDSLSWHINLNQVRWQSVLTRQPELGEDDSPSWHVNLNQVKMTAHCDVSTSPVSRWHVMTGHPVLACWWAVDCEPIGACMQPA